MVAELVVPSPKLQKYEVTEPVALFVNRTVRGAVPETTFVVKFDTGAAGAGFTVIVILTLLLPPGPVTVNVAVYVPV